MHRAIGASLRIAWWVNWLCIAMMFIGLAVLSHSIERSHAENQAIDEAELAAISDIQTTQQRVLQTLDDHHITDMELASRQVVHDREIELAISSCASFQELSKEFHPIGGERDRDQPVSVISIGNPTDASLKLRK